MIRLGIIGTDNQHAYEYSALVNGWDESVPAPLRIPAGSAETYTNKLGWMYGLRLAERGIGPKVPLENAIVSKIWSHNHSEAVRIADACSIEYVAGQPEDVLVDIDAALILSEEPSSHRELAIASLKRGIPTFVDKPLADSMETALELQELADGLGVPWFSGSSLRFDPTIQASAEFARSTIGEPVHYQILVPRTGHLYMIHAVEMLNLFSSVVGAVSTIQSSKSRDVAFVELTNGATATLETIWSIQRSVYRVFAVGDLGTFDAPPLHPIQGSAGQLNAVVSMALSGQAPVPAEEFLEVLRVALGSRPTDALLG